MSYYISFNDGEKVVQISSFDHMIKRTEIDGSENEYIIYQLSTKVANPATNYPNLLGTFESYYRNNSISSLSITDSNEDVVFETERYTEMFSENLILDDLGDETPGLIYTLNFEKVVQLEEEE